MNREKFSEKFPNLTSTLGESFWKEAEENHIIRNCRKNDVESYLDNFDKLIEATPSKRIYENHKNTLKIETKFRGFITELKCYYFLSQVVDDLEHVDEKEGQTGYADFTSESLNTDFEATFIGKHNPANELAESIRAYVNRLAEDYRARLILKDDYLKRAASGKTISINEEAVERFKAHIESLEEPENIETEELKLRLKKSSEGSYYEGSAWENVEEIDLDPEGKIEEKAKRKASKNTVQENLVIFIEIDRIFPDLASLKELAFGGATLNLTPNPIDVSPEIKQEPERIKNYLIEEELIPSEGTSSAIEPGKEGFLADPAFKNVAGIIFKTNKAIGFVPNIYHNSEKAADVLEKFGETNIEFV